MFSIYEVTGRSFRDTLENLRKVKRKPSPRRLDKHSRNDQGRDIASKAETLYAQACQRYRQAFPVSERERVIHAHQIMTSPVSTIAASANMVAAWKQHEMFGFRQMPVLNDEGRLVGLLTESDMLRHIILEDNAVVTRRVHHVAEIMSREVIAADPVTDVRRIAAVMLDYQQSAVPIMNEADELTGIISRSDILRATSSDPPLSLWT